MASDTATYEAMTPRELVAAYLSYRLTARRSDGDRFRDTYQARILEEVAQARGLTPLLVEGFQQMKRDGWRDLPADVARDVCQPEEATP